MRFMVTHLPTLQEGLSSRAFWSGTSGFVALACASLQRSGWALAYFEEIRPRVAPKIGEPTVDIAESIVIRFDRL
jgi:hypothetical protein